MDYVIAAFRSRNITMKAYEYLVRHGVNCALSSTPRGANVGCGLSVRFAPESLETVARLVGGAESFAGFFHVRHTDRGTVVTRV